MIDVNVNLARWPFRRVPGDEAAELVAGLRRHGVTQAWAGSFEGIFHKDIAAANARLSEECRTNGPGFLVPFGSINPKLPDWREDLRRCEELGMRGIRMHPNYHGYRLDDPACAELMALAATRKLIVQLVPLMEDDRTQHPLMYVPPVGLKPLPDLVQGIRGLRLVVLNCRVLPAREELQRLAAAGQVYFDFAMLESPGIVSVLSEATSYARVLFGSNAPLFYFESTEFKLAEAGLKPMQKTAILEGNARRLWAGASD